MLYDVESAYYGGVQWRVRCAYFMHGISRSRRIDIINEGNVGNVVWVRWGEPGAMEYIGR
jgi:hypothetical protein